MPDNNHETTDFFARVAVYATGIILGIGAKLVTINKEKKLTMKDVIFHTVIAFATAWVVWWIFEDKINENVLVSISVVVGRFGDVLLIAIGKITMKWVRAMMDNNENLK